MELKVQCTEIKIKQSIWLWDFELYQKGIYSCFLTSCYLQSWILKTPVPACYGSMLCSVQCLHVKWSFKIQKGVLVLGTSAIHTEQNIQMLWFIKYWMAVGWFFPWPYDVKMRTNAVEWKWTWILSDEQDVTCFLIVLSMMMSLPIV